eukprot:8163630-Alexandrium_andersonii.AAC.1
MCSVDPTLPFVRRASKRITLADTWRWNSQGIINAWGFSDGNTSTWTGAVVLEIDFGQAGPCACLSSVRAC